MVKREGLGRTTAPNGLIVVSITYKNSNYNDAFHLLALKWLVKDGQVE